MVLSCTYTRKVCGNNHGRVCITEKCNGSGMHNVKRLQWESNSKWKSAMEIKHYIVGFHKKDLSCMWITGLENLLSTLRHLVGILFLEIDIVGTLNSYTNNWLQMMESGIHRYRSRCWISQRHMTCRCTPQSTDWESTGNWLGWLPDTMDQWIANYLTNWMQYVVVNSTSSNSLLVCPRFHSGDYQYNFLVEQLTFCSSF